MREVSIKSYYMMLGLKGPQAPSGPVLSHPLDSQISCLSDGGAPLQPHSAGNWEKGHSWAALSVGQ